jgi:transcriptional regulator with XRE-family HTH domain
MSTGKSIQAIIAFNMKKGRDDQGWTQAKLAEEIGLSLTYIAELEIAKKSPSIEVVQKLADALGLRPFELFLEPGVDDNPDASREILRSYTKEAILALNKAVKDTLQDLAKKHLDS